MILYLAPTFEKHAVAVGSEPGRADHGIISLELAEWIRIVQATIDVKYLGIEMGPELEEECEVDL